MKAIKATMANCIAGFRRTGKSTAREPGFRFLLRYIVSPNQKIHPPHGKGWILWFGLKRFHRAITVSEDFKELFQPHGVQNKINCGLWAEKFHMLTRGLVPLRVERAEAGTPGAIRIHILPREYQRNCMQGHQPRA